MNILFVSMLQSVLIATDRFEIDENDLQLNSNSSSQAIVSYSLDLQQTAQYPQKTIRHPVPTEHLTSQDIQLLKYEWIKFVAGIPAIEKMNLKTRAGWVKVVDLNDLDVLCSLNNENFNRDLGIEKPVRKAQIRFYQLIENIHLKSDYLTIFGNIKELRDSLQKLDSNNSLSFFQSMNGIQQSSNIDFKEFYPIIPVLQKIMRNLVWYHQTITKAALNLDNGHFAIGTSEFNLGYIPNYLPFIFESDEIFSVKRLPYKLYTEADQSMVLMMEGRIEQNTGIVIMNSVKSALVKAYFDKTPQDYSKNFINTFIYMGTNAPYPFTIAPWEIHDYQGLEHMIGKNVDTQKVRAILQDQFPAQDDINFIALPMTVLEKDIMELLFLEELYKTAQNGKSVDIKAVAQQMIAYIEQETSQGINEIIAELTQSVMQAQIDIMEEQAKISAQVAQNQIVGKKKSNNINKTKQCSKKDYVTKPNQKSEKFDNLDNGKLDKKKVLKDLKLQGKSKIS